MRSKNRKEDIPLDDIDRTLIRLLRANGRLSQEQLAREVHLSRPAVHERIRRLEEEGVIRGYKAVLDWSALGMPVVAFVWVRTGKGPCGVTSQAIMQLQSSTAIVEECHRVAGEWCMMLKTRSASPLALQDLLDQIRDLSGVEATMTTVALSTLGEDCALQPPHHSGENSHLSLSQQAS